MGATDYHSALDSDRLAAEIFQTHVPDHRILGQAQECRLIRLSQIMARGLRWSWAYHLPSAGEILIRVTGPANIAPESGQEYAAACRRLNGTYCARKSDL